MAPSPRVSEFSVIILDDEYDKIEEIMLVLSDSGIQARQVVKVSTSNEARKAMREHRFDLLILDMNVPPLLGAAPDPNGGISLLKMMLLDGAAKFPSQVIGITAKESIFSAAEKEMKSLSWTLCFYDKGSDDWRFILKQKVGYSVQAKNSESPVALESFDVVLITALRETEFAAVLNLDIDWEQISYAGDISIYYRGLMETATGPIKIIAASTLRMGMPSASALSMKMSLLFRPKLIAMVGICAGKKGTCGLGDIVVADPVWDWGSGKLKVVKGEKRFAIAPHQVAIDAGFRLKILDIKGDAAILSEIRSGWGGAVPGGQLEVFIGPMASGASVVSDLDIMRDIEQQNRNTIAVEMEAYAVMAAAEYAIRPAPKAIVIKSVCDFGDASKHSKWQKYASYTSAMFFFLFLRDHAGL